MKIVQNSESINLVIDTYAWLEYFKGGEEGKRAAELIDGDSKMYTPSIVIAELSNKYRKEGLQDRWEKERLIFIEVKSSIVTLDSSIANLAGQIKVEKRKEYADFGMADAIIIATAEKLNSKIVTGDKHFKSEKNVIDINKDSCKKCS